MLLVLLSGQQDSRKLIAVGLPAPDFEVVDARSSVKFSSAEHKGKVTFVNFWATWCQPCREEMPSIEALYRELYNNENFQLITILYRDNPQTALEYMRQNGYTFPLYVDSDSSSSSRVYGVTGVPETYLLDKHGILKKKVIGPAEWNSPEEKNLILSLLRG